MMPLVQVHCFTNAYKGISNVIATKVGIQQAFDPNVNLPTDPTTEYSAIWDTGATNTAITNKVATECGLLPTGMCKVRTANGENDTCTYFVSLYLPNKVCLPQLRVSQATLFGADILIGMDVIGSGDFVITNFQGKTYMSFRMPSIECIDFVKQAKIKNLIQPKSIKKISKNASCPCGALHPDGTPKKYKHCCGKNVA